MQTGGMLCARPFLDAGSPTVCMVSLFALCPDVFAVEGGCPRAISIELLSCHLPVRAMSRLQVPLQVKKETPASLALLSRFQAMLWRGARPTRSLLTAFSGLFSPSSPSSASEHSYSLGSAFARSKGGLQVSADHPHLGSLWGLNQPNSCSRILAGFDPEAAKTTELAECCVLQSGRGVQHRGTLWHLHPCFIRSPARAGQDLHFPSPSLSRGSARGSRSRGRRGDSEHQFILRCDLSPWHPCRGPCLTKGQCSSDINESLLLRTAV